MQYVRDTRFIPVLGAMLALLLAALDQTIVATALPEIVNDLQGLEHLSWIVTAYLLASTVTVPLAGKLSDIYGRHLFFLLGIVVFLIGSALSGAAWSMGVLILFRVVQGIGAGAIIVSAYAVVGDMFSPAERGPWLGFIGAAFGLASIVGPLIGGWLTDIESWRLIFYVNIPIGLMAFLIVWLTLPHREERKAVCPIDFRGAAFLTLTLVPLLLILVWGGTRYEWVSSVIVGLIVLSLVSFILFIRAELHAVDPIVPLFLFKHRGFSVSVAVMFLMMIAMFGIILFMPLYAQGIFGYNATYAGLILMPMTIALVVASVVVGQIIAHTGKYKMLIVLGILMTAVGMFLFTRLTADTTEMIVVIDMALVGIGLGTVFPVLNLVVQSIFHEQYLGVSTSTLQVGREIGGAFGAALLGGYLNNALGDKIPTLRVDYFMHYLPRDLTLTIDSIEHFLTPGGRGEILALLPRAESQPVHDAYVHFLELVRAAFASSLAEAYLISTVAVGVAFLLILFLPVIVLRKHPMRPVALEAGIELEEELGLSDPEHEYEE